MALCAYRGALRRGLVGRPLRCRECGLADEGTHDLIETMIASRANLTRDDQYALWEQQWSDDQREEMELCRPCTEAVLNTVDFLVADPK